MPAEICIETKQSYQFDITLSSGLVKLHWPPPLDKNAFGRGWDDEQPSDSVFNHDIAVAASGLIRAIVLAKQSLMG